MVLVIDFLADPVYETYCVQLDIYIDKIFHINLKIQVMEHPKGYSDI